MLCDTLSHANVAALKKNRKSLSIIAGCTVYSSCLLCKLLCNHGFRVISSLIDAFARSSTSGSLCCRVTCLCICMSADAAGQRRWILAFHEQASVGTTRLRPTFSFSLWSSVFKKESSCSHCSHFSIRSYGDATVCVGDAHKE